VGARIGAVVTGASKNLQFFCNFVSTNQISYILI
ncbi:uncharacterized protein METZ01_LOCUS227656, partial [marine metagenome]